MDQNCKLLANDDAIVHLQKWEGQNLSNAMFKSMMNYLHWVETKAVETLATDQALTVHHQLS